MKTALAILVIAFAIAFFAFFKPEKNGSIVKVAGQTLKTDIADDIIEQEKGLSGRESLSEDHAMLFVFDYPGRHDFWMKDMSFPIDMIWIGEDMRVIYIEKNARPESYPRIFGPQAEAKYVLETVSGFSDTNNLKVGDLIEIFIRK